MAAALETRVRRLEGRRSDDPLADFTLADLREAKRELEADPADGPVSELVRGIWSAMNGGKAQ